MQARIILTPTFTIPSEGWTRPQQETFLVALPTKSNIQYNAASLVHDIALCYVESMPTTHQGHGIGWTFKIEYYEIHNRTVKTP